MTTAHTRKALPASLAAVLIAAIALSGCVAVEHDGYRHGYQWRDHHRDWRDHDHNYDRDHDRYYR